MSTSVLGILQRRYSGAQEVVGQRLGIVTEEKKISTGGEAGKEKYMGLVEANIAANGQDEQVSNQCDGVNEQKEDEEDIFLFLLTANSHIQIMVEDWLFPSHGSFSRKGERNPELTVKCCV